jgi:hypothetical protein
VLGRIEREGTSRSQGPQSGVDTSEHPLAA